MSSGERTGDYIPTPPSSVGKKTYLNSRRSWLAGMGRGLSLFPSPLLYWSREGLCSLLDIP